MPGSASAPWPWRQGTSCGFPRSVALLSSGYSAGRIIGPLAVTPFLHDGYRQALAPGAVVVVAVATAPAALRAWSRTGAVR